MTLNPARLGFVLFKSSKPKIHPWADDPWSATLNDKSFDSEKQFKLRFHQMTSRLSGYLALPTISFDIFVLILCSKIQPSWRVFDFFLLEKLCLVAEGKRDLIEKGLLLERWNWKKLLLWYEIKSGPFVFSYGFLRLQTNAY